MTILLVVHPLNLNHRPYRILRIPWVGDLQKGPTSKSAVVVHRRHPQRAGGGHFGRLVFARLAAHFNDQAQQVVLPTATVYVDVEITTSISHLLTR